MQAVDISWVKHKVNSQGTLRGFTQRQNEDQHLLSIDCVCGGLFKNRETEKYGHMKDRQRVLVLEGKCLIYIIIYRGNSGLQVSDRTSFNILSAK